MKRIHSLALALALVALAGCADNTLEVRGTVAYDDKPVAYGTISFEPADGEGPTSGGEITDGKYELKDRAKLTPGAKIVRIRASHKFQRKAEVMPGQFKDTEDIVPYIPADYNDRTTLRAEVKPGEPNEINFNLKPPAKSATR